MPGRYSLFAYSIDDKKLYRKGHLVERWRSDILHEIERAIWSAAPVNKRRNKSRHFSTFGGFTPRGYLRSGIEAVKTPAVGRHIEGTVVSHAEYTLAVIHGTKGGTKKTAPGTRRTAGGQFAGKAPVDPRPSHLRPAHRIRFYAIPSNPGFGYGWKQRFKGQTPNNFMATGWNRVAAKHRALKKIRP